jgi:hypothetical protein
MMPVAKLKCKCGCKKFQLREKVVKTPFGNFYNKEHAIKFAQDKSKRDLERKKKKAEQSQVKKEKAVRTDLKERKEKLKSASDWNKEAQAAVNKYIKFRDHGRPCISCGCELSVNYGGTTDCGHYRSRGSASHLRFNLLNMASQCSRCNRYLSGNVVEYRKELINRIGAERVEQLESDNQPRKFNVEYLKRVKRIFNKRARFYEKRIKAR